ncbi:unnamed protein product [Staurois parvus]|uniref:Uncharacterized protein n=1 Tax=Staurois parvus TaxID=386267 RepID=A0ABN9C5G3_9NEOB|nr:unnamed protein product [Staurois parvus]
MNAGSWETRYSGSMVPGRANIVNSGSGESGYSGCRSWESGYCEYRVWGDRIQ